MQTLTAPTHTSHWQQPFWFALAGLLVGLLAQNLDWLYTDASGKSTSWVGLQGMLPFALMLFLPVMLLLWKAGRGIIAPLFLAVILAVASWVGLQAQVTFVDAEMGYMKALSGMTFANYLLLLAAVGISLTFAQAWQPERPHFPYPRLFTHAWENVHTVALAIAFALLTFVLIMAAAGLFGTILPQWSNGVAEGGNTLVIKVWENYLVIGLTAFGTAIGVIQQYSGLLLRLHTLVFALYTLLAYLMAFIIIGFALVLLPQWQAFLADKEAASLLLGLVAVSILFLNTLVERGSATLPTWAQALFAAQLLVLPFITALAVYAIDLRVGQYGLSPQRVLGLLVGMLLLAYTVAYAVQWLRYRRDWTQGVKVVNPALALLAAILALLVLTPVLDPQGWSARNQLARLHSSEVEAKLFDYHALRHTFGKPGVEAIATLKGWKDHPQYAVIIKGIDDAADPYASVSAQPTAKAETLAKISVVPASKTVDVEKFLNRAQDVSMLGMQARQCFEPIMPTTECLLVLQDMNGDGKDEGLLLGFVSVEGALDGVSEYHLDANLYTLDADGLPVRGKSLSNATIKTTAENGGFSSEQQYTPLDKATFEQVKAAAKAEQLIPVMPELPELQVGGQRLREQ